MPSRDANSASKFMSLGDIGEKIFAALKKLNEISAKIGNYAARHLVNRPVSVPDAGTLVAESVYE